MDIPFNWIDDIMRYINLRDALDDSDDIHAPPDAYEDQDIDDGMKRMNF